MLSVKPTSKKDRKSPLLLPAKIYLEKKETQVGLLQEPSLYVMVLCLTVYYSVGYKIDLYH